MTPDEQLCSWDVCHPDPDEDEDIAGGEWYEGRPYELPCPIESYVPRSMDVPSSIICHVEDCRDYRSFGSLVPVPMDGLLTNVFSAQDMTAFLLE